MPVNCPELQVSRTRTFILTSFAMMAFAGNSLLCRAALKSTAIDAASFTSVRLVSGGLTLWLIMALKGGLRHPAGSWPSAAALFAYAAAFSFAYASLPAATGALLLFGAVQATMIGYGLWKGERFSGRQAAGLLLACGGLVWLLVPGLTAPPLHGSALMLVAGMAWGVYSLRGRGAANPTNVTAGNFIRAAPLGLLLSLATFSHNAVDTPGVIYAVASGALASGVGYALWYAAMGGLKATSAATVQLSVPVLAAAGGMAFLGEPVTLRFVVAAFSILGGIALVILPVFSERPLAKRLRGQ